MRYSDFVRATNEHSEALLTAARAAGPDVPVPTCPGWTMRRLVRHLAKVQSWVRATIADPSGAPGEAERPPEGWPELLAWWAGVRSGLNEAFAAGPDAPAWVPFSGFAPTAGSWARRMAHEAAIHRLDGELAAGDESLVFEPEFAADGIDELLAGLLPGRPDWAEGSASGSVLVHAADAQRVWTVWLAAGVAPEVRAGAEVPAGFEADATVAGTADSVYRAVWGRPSEAAVFGEAALLEPLAAP